MDGSIKLKKEAMSMLKGMNSNYLTSCKEFDYRFLSRLLLELFAKDELAKSCVKVNESTNGSIYENLDKSKFDFIKGLCI